MQQILLMTNSDDEVEIVFLPVESMRLAYDSELTAAYSYGMSSKPSDILNDFSSSIADQNSAYYHQQNLSSHSPIKTPTRSKFYSSIEPTMNSLSRRFSLSSIANIWSK